MRSLTRQATRLLTVVALSAPLTAQAQVAWFVDDGGDNSANGQTWATAVRTLQEGIDRADASGLLKIVLVAHGVYGPAQSGGGTIQLADNVRIHGGYLGGVSGSTSEDNPDGSFLQTQINGITGPYDTGPVVESIGNEGAVLDGFVIQGGDVDVGDAHGTSGAGLYCEDPVSVHIENVTFRNNTAAGAGGGILLIGGYVEEEEGLEIDRCTFYDNLASYGAGICIGLPSEGGGARMSNCIFFDNGDEDTIAGGAIYPRSLTYLRAKNCLIHDNVAEEGGGVFIFPDDGSGTAADTHTFTHCTIANNVVENASSGSGIHMDPSGTGSGGILIENSIVYGNTVGYDIFRATPVAPNGIPLTVRNSCYSTTSGVITNGGGNITSNPLFINAAGGNYQLDPSPTVSPCIDAGEDDYRGPDYCDVDEDGPGEDPIEWDLRLAGRTVDFPNVGGSDEVDMGALECHDID